MFKLLKWQADQMALNGLNFRLQHTKNENWVGGNDHFIFYKVKGLVDQYETYFKNYPENAQPKNVLELGMWDGGSLAFWNEILKPEKIVGVDLIENGGNDYFQEYLYKINLQSKKAAPYWATNQADAARLREIIAENFGNEPLNLVFDDASHMYEPSLVSFNTIFPFMATGGVYIIEDWAWGHWKGFESMFPPNTQPTKLIFELVQAAGNVGLIESVSIFQGFVVVKRGIDPIEGKKEDFKLENYIYNIPNSSKYFGYLKNNSFKNKLKTAFEILLK
jgi:hypothetical protein